MMLIAWLVPAITCVNAGIFFTEFVQFMDLNNYVCDADEEMIRESFESTVWCLRKCSEDPTCKSVVLDSGMCIGCSKIHVDTTGLVPKAGATLYNKITGANCSLIACEHPNQICFDGNNCICGHGYKFDANIQRCVTGCSTYGNTYQLYEGQVLNLHHIAYYNNIELADCKDHCSHTPACRSFSIYKPLKECWLFKFTALDAHYGNEYVEHPDCQYGTRNCE